MAEEKTYPDFSFTYEASFTNPIDKVWACIEDFAGWGKWFPPLADMHIIGDGIDKVGAIRVVKSAATGITYEEVQRVKDPVEHKVEYGIVKRDPPVPFMKYQVVSAQLISKGKNETQLIGEVIVTPNCEVPEETKENYKALVRGAFTRVYGGLEATLNSWKQQQTFPDFVFPYEASFTNPIDKVWACIEDFAGWGKWYPPLADMKIIGDGIDKVGAIRVVKSAATGITYEEVQRAKDPVEHRVEYGIFKRDPPVPFMKYQIVSAQLVSKGENETQLIGEVIMTPNCELTEEIKENYKALVQGAFKRVYGGLEETLNSWKQPSQN